MAPPILTLQNVHLTFGGTPLLEGAEFSIGERERLCLIGRNGSGKSTLLKIAAGLIEADKGERFVQPGVTIRYLPQEPDLSGHDTVLNYVDEGLAPGDDPHRARTLLENLGLTGDEAPRYCQAGKPAEPPWPVSSPPRRTSCCSTSRPTTSTCPPLSGSNRSSRGRGPRWF